MPLYFSKPFIPWPSPCDSFQSPFIPTPGFPEWPSGKDSCEMVKAGTGLASISVSNLTLLIMLSWAFFYFSYNDLLQALNLSHLLPAIEYLQKLPGASRRLFSVDLCYISQIWLRDHFFKRSFWLLQIGYILVIQIFGSRNLISPTFYLWHRRYMDNVCPTLNSWTDALTIPQPMWWYWGVGGWWLEPDEVLRMVPWGGGHLRAKKNGWNVESEYPGTSILDIPVSRTVRQKCLLKPQSMIFLLEQPELTETDFGTRSRVM